MAEAKDRQKLEINGLPLRVAGVTIRLVGVDREQRAAFVTVEVDSEPRFVKPSDVVMKAQA